MSANDQRDEGQGDQDQQLIELVNELRVAVTGVQVLFAFLLLVPFTSGFDYTTSGQRLAFSIGFVCAAAATLLMIGPSVYRWFRWDEPHTESMVRVMRGLALTGSAFLASAIVAVIYLVTDTVLGGGLPWLITAMAALLAIVIWYFLPWWRGGHRHRAGT